jgi:hypothetical protein
LFEELLRMLAPVVVPVFPGAIVFAVPLPTRSEPMELPLESTCPWALATAGSAMTAAANAAISSLEPIRSLLVSLKAFQRVRAAPVPIARSQTRWFLSGRILRRARSWKSVSGRAFAGELAIGPGLLFELRSHFRVAFLGSQSFKRERVLQIFVYQFHCGSPSRAAS